MIRVFFGGETSSAEEAAHAAYDAAAEAMGWRAPMLDDYLEAAGLLLDGWNPGEPVELLASRHHGKAGGR